MKIKKILVSQPKPATEKSPYYDIAERYGVEMVFRPFIKVESLSAKEFRQQKVSILDHTAVIFTSRHAIDHFFTLCGELRVTIPETMKYFCTSEQVALYIQKYVQYRKRKVFFGATGKFIDLLPAIVSYTEQLARTASLKKSVIEDVSLVSEVALIKKLSQAQTDLYNGIEKLKADNEAAKSIEDHLEAAKFYQSVVLKDMADIRVFADEAEAVMPESMLPYPTYGQLLFSI